jgi:glycerate 2-kinase
MAEHQIIKNRGELETSALRVTALDIIEAGIERVLPSTIMRSALSYEPNPATLIINGDKCLLHGRLFVIGAGKASGLMAQTLEQIVEPPTITEGLIIEKAAPGDFVTAKIRIVQAGHPVPDWRGVEAAQEILALKQKYSIGKDDLVLGLISGGGSALMPCPLEGITLQDKGAVTSLLLASGADIGEINSVRKHLSRTKGGQLAQYFAPARVVSLILSDVIGNNLGVIASGPTCADESTFSTAYAVLEKYNLLEKIPAAVMAALQKGCRGEIPETPKTLYSAANYIIGDVRIALDVMAQKARQSGFKPLIISSSQIGDTASLAAQRAQQIMQGAFCGYDALLIGGESTPALPVRHGRGGRNQHYALCTLAQLKDYPGEWLLASVGTDGSDYIPEAAGAMVDSYTLPILKGKDLELQKAIAEFDSYGFLGQTGNSLIVTGDTHTNVGDVILYLFEPETQD